MYYVRVNGNVKIAVEDINPNGKTTILLIHGWPLGQKIFEYQKNILPRLGFRIVTMDLRGFGLSDATADGYSYDQLATDIYHVVNQLGLRRFVLCGFSMGGAIAIRYMSLFKNYQVSKLVLIGAAAPSFVQRPGYPYGMTREAVDKLIAQTYRDRPQMATDFGEMLFAVPHSSAVKSWFRDISFSASGIGTIQTAKSLRDEDLRCELKNIHVPTGIFHGKLDKVCPFVFAERMHEGIKGSQLYPFDRSGHAVFYDELEEFNDCLLSFVGR